MPRFQTLSRIVEFLADKAANVDASTYHPMVAHLPPPDDRRPESVRGWLHEGRLALSVLIQHCAPRELDRSATQVSRFLSRDSVMPDDLRARLEEWVEIQTHAADVAERSQVPRPASRSRGLRSAVVLDELNHDAARVLSPGDGIAYQYDLLRSRLLTGFLLHPDNTLSTLVSSRRQSFDAARLSTLAASAAFDVLTVPGVVSRADAA